MFHGTPLFPRRPSVEVRYIVAIGAAVVALVLSLLLRPIIEPTPFLLFFAAVALSAWYGGLLPGCLTAALAVVATNYFLIPPYNAFSLSLNDLTRGVIFVFVAALISSLTEARRRAEARAQAQAEQFQVTLGSI